jgi:hypothetical protein
VRLHSFLTLDVDRGEWSASHPGRFNPRESAIVTNEYRAREGPKGVPAFCGKETCFAAAGNRSTIPRVRLSCSEVYKSWTNKF